MGRTQIRDKLTDRLTDGRTDGGTTRRLYAQMTNHHTKFEVPRPKLSLVIDRKLFLPIRSM
jgi:hypothetical protein